jgi:hypothetical protein
VAFRIVVLLVAPQTHSWRIPVLTAFVAAGTFDFFVFAYQGKTRFAVVKLDFFPGLVLVAIGTFFTQGALVLVVLAVACNTL